jgi:alpha-glucosidase
MNAIRNLSVTENTRDCPGEPFLSENTVPLLGAPIAGSRAPGATLVQETLLRLSSLLVCLGFLAGCAGPSIDPNLEPLSLRSPDNTIAVTVNTHGPLRYAVEVDGRPVLRESRLGLRLGGGVELGRDVELLKATRAAADTTWDNPFGKRRLVRDQHNELRLTLRERGRGRVFEVIFRASNDGVGLRYSLPAESGWRDFILEEEQTEFAFAGNWLAYAGEHEKKGFAGPQEWEFKPRLLGELPATNVCGLPLLVQTPAAWVALTEADLFDWSGLWLSRSAAAGTNFSRGVTLAARLAPRPDGQGLVKATAPHVSPWRVLMIGRQPGRLIESDLVLNLSTPCRLPEVSWIKPGLMAWDRWWSGLGKVDTATMKDFIQLASDMGWAYQLIDAGWYVRTNTPGNITNVVETLDLAELRRFADEKGVRLWVWLHWRDVDRGDAWREAFAVYEQAGIAGVKIDYMDRDDQEMVNWYEKITRAAAEHHLMVDFHGAFKPTGMNRTYPNQITREGVLGNEYNKWSRRVTPEHKVTLPFTRFLAGPGDYTPGGFLNRQPAPFHPQTNGSPTQVQGTRAAELALFLVYDSPVGCVCDHPDHYRDQAGADFLEHVPTVWDETRVLDGVVARQLVMARRSGEDWYLGALTDSQARDIVVALDFLGPGQWGMTWWKDAADSGVNAEDLVVEEGVVTAKDSVTLRLAPAGGAVARFQKE